MPTVSHAKAPVPAASKRHTLVKELPETEHHIRELEETCIASPVIETVPVALVKELDTVVPDILITFSVDAAVTSTVAIYHVEEVSDQTSIRAPPVKAVYMNTAAAGALVTLAVSRDLTKI